MKPSDDSKVRALIECNAEFRDRLSAQARAMAPGNLQLNRILESWKRSGVASCREFQEWAQSEAGLAPALVEIEKQAAALQDVCKRMRRELARGYSRCLREDGNT